MSLDRFEQLRRDARELGNTPAKVALLEEAVRLVDSLGNIEEAFRTRLDLVSAAIFSNMTDRAMVAFSWCLAQADREPEKYATYNLIWKYKWMLGAATEFPGISLPRIREMQRDFETRLKQNGNGLSPYHKLRMENAREMGYLAEGLHFEKVWHQSGRDFMADCRACEVNSQVEACIVTGRYQQAIRTAERIMSGELRCSGVPGHTYWKLIFARLARGEIREAGELFTAGYPLAARREEFLVSVGWHLCYLIRVRDLKRGFDLVERHLPWAQQSGSPVKRMIFYSFAADFFECFAEAHPRPRKIRIPTALAVYRPDNRYSPAELAAWFRAQADDLAAQFDGRNGNSYVSWFLANGHALAMGLPLSKYVEVTTDDTLIAPSPQRKIRGGSQIPQSQAAKRKSTKPASAPARKRTARATKNSKRKP